MYRYTDTSSISDDDHNYTHQERNKEFLDELRKKDHRHQKEGRKRTDRRANDRRDPPDRRDVDHKEAMRKEAMRKGADREANGRDPEFRPVPTAEVKRNGGGMIGGMGMNGGGMNGGGMNGGTPVPTNGCITEDFKAGVLKLWQAIDSKASVSKEWSTPTVMLLTHQLGTMPMTLDGVTSMSPLANNALLSIECVTINGRKDWLMMYEIMIPDIPGVRGEASTAEVYRNSLNDQGLRIDGDHYHWKGASRLMNAIHHKQIGGDPLEFCRKTITALQAVKSRLT